MRIGARYCARMRVVTVAAAAASATPTSGRGSRRPESRVAGKQSGPAAEASRPTRAEGKNIVFRAGLVTFGSYLL